MKTEHRYVSPKKKEFSKNSNIAKKYAILLGFLPWVIFSITVNHSTNRIIEASFVAIICLIIIDFKQLKKLFLFPVCSVIYFIFTAFNAYFNIIPLLNSSQIMISNIALACIVWGSIIIQKPFTLQYAKEEVEEKYWTSPIFKKTNWYLTFSWAVILSVMAIPSLIISQDLYIKSWFWNYGFSIVLILLGIYINNNLPNWLMGRNFWNAVKNLPHVDSPFLKNGYKPVFDEVNLTNLDVTGNLPHDLTGRYLRNGPNPFFTPYTYTYPIDGDGMIHELSFKGGQVDYKNVFVKTNALVAEMKAGKALYGGIKLPIPADPRYVQQDEDFKNTAAINVLPWQDKILAFYEAENAYVLDQDLNTIGIWQPDINNNVKVNAHYRIDHKTGQTYMCTHNDDHGNFLIIYEFNAKQELVKTTKITKSRSTMIHDFVITQNYIIVFDCPAIFNTNPDFSNKDENFFDYYPEQDVKVILIKRSDYSVTTIENLPSFLVYHFVNAYEENDEIIIDFVLHKALNLNTDSLEKTQGPHLFRGKIDLKTLNYSQEFLLNDVAVEFPIYNLINTGYQHRYTYLAAKKSDFIGSMNNILRYDFQSKTYSMTNFGDNFEVDEPVFIPRESSNNEDDAYIGCYLYNKATDHSDFVILDAVDLHHEIARVKLPRRVPHGLHGIWQNRQ